MHLGVTALAAIDETGLTAELLEMAQDPAIASLADQIVNQEKELTEMFEPGKVMPSVRTAMPGCMGGIPYPYLECLHGCMGIPTDLPEGSPRSEWDLEGGWVLSG